MTSCTHKSYRPISMGVLKPDAALSDDAGSLPVGTVRECPLLCIFHYICDFFSIVLLPVLIKCQLLLDLCDSIDLCMLYNCNDIAGVVFVTVEIVGWAVQFSM